MNEQQIRAKHLPRKVNNQIEFDTIMRQINDDQTMTVRPIIDAKTANVKQRESIRSVIATLRQQIIDLKLSTWN